VQWRSLVDRRKLPLTFTAFPSTTVAHQKEHAMREAAEFALTVPVVPTASGGLVAEHCAGTRPFDLAIQSIVEGNKGLPRWLTSAMDQSTCGLRLCVGQKVVFANREARRTGNVDPADATALRGHLNIAVVLVPLTGRGTNELNATLVITGERSLCEELAARADLVLGEIEGFLALLGHMRVDERALLTMLFTDIVDSTACAERLGDARWQLLLARHHSIVRRQLTVFRGHEVDDSGDGFFATFDAPARAVRCAQAIRDDVRLIGLEIRAGIHTGECEIVGRKVAGAAVHLAARVAATAKAGQILVSSTVKELAAGSDLCFAGGDLHSFKGVSDPWRLFSVNSAASIAN